ncbi:YdcH family protein [Sphaerotilus sp.]|uniref:YdcH family protein n=1 Tax=Sphaerotilus sp. TaxID=2093942 RepID=UPI0034E1E45F
MFPEYRDLISQLKTTDHHFANLFDRHNALDQEIKNMEARILGGTHEEIEAAKKAKLVLKDQLHAILRKAGATA